jgi:hypothetical protein
MIRRCRGDHASAPSPTARGGHRRIFPKSYAKPLQEKSVWLTKHFGPW